MTLQPLEASLFEKLADDVKELMLASGVFPVIDPFMQLYSLPKGTNMVICIGGRGGAKTYEVSRFSMYDATTKYRRVAILRDEKETIRESILNEIFLRYEDAKMYNHFKKDFERTERGIKNKTTDNMVVFTKGFRASSNLKRTNLKGVSDVDTAIVEEAEDIRDYSKFNTFVDSIRTEDKLIIIMLNTPDIQHWVVKRFFNLVQVEDGYWQLVPKGIPGVVVIQTSYKDNIYLPNHVIKDYEGSGDENSHRYDPHYYKTDILGYASSGRKGQVLTKIKPISLKDYLALPYREYYGQDFGTASPAGFVGVKIHKNTSWCRQLNYKPMETLDIAKMYCKLKLNIADEITADNADEKAWKRLKSGYSGHELSDEEFRNYPMLAVGWNVGPCIKGTDSVNYGIDVMRSMNLYAVQESTDLWDEILNYIYAQDKYGNYTNDPIDDYNHLIDPWRYVINKHRGKARVGITAA